MIETLLAGASLATIAKLAFAPFMFGYLSGGTNDYQIARSVRLKPTLDAALARVFGVPTNQNIWTFSTWVKRTGIGTYQGLFGASTGPSPAYDAIRFDDTDVFRIFCAGGVPINLGTTAVFRDTSAWMHVCVAFDLTQATAADRVKLCVNGVQVALTGTYPVQNPANTAYNFNRSASTHTVGSHVVNGAQSLGINGYLAETIFIDGQALTPSSFIANDPVTDVPDPIRYTGTYGANGFRLDYSDNSAATTTTMGADRSGNGNNHNVIAISVTAGYTGDSMVDTPTNYGAGLNTGLGGQVRGNYCVMNALDCHPSVVVSQGGLEVSHTASMMIRGTFAIPSTGKWYWEVHCIVASGTGIARGNANTSLYLGQDSNGWTYASDGNLYTSGVASGYGAVTTAGNMIGVLFDADAGTVTFYKDNVSQGVAVTGLTAATGPYYPATGINTTSTAGFNFGQKGFIYSAPAGAKTLCTENLPDPVIKKSSRYFDVHTRTGTGANTSVTGKAFSPDMLWIKQRSAGTTDNMLFDTERGASDNLRTNLLAAQTNPTPTNDSLLSFNGDGYSLGANVNAGGGYTNVAGATYVDWMWEKGVTPGLDIILFNKVASTIETFAHTLGVAPAMMIVKARSISGNFGVWHKGIPATDYLALNTLDAKITSPTVWNSAAPSSSVITLGTAWNASSSIAYIFAEVPGFSKFGSYTGNGSANGPFVHCGFRPRWVMIKRTDAAADWYIWDTARDTVNVAGNELYANLALAETPAALDLDILSNGFKIRRAGSAFNTNGANHIFAAFAAGAFKYSRAR